MSTGLILIFTMFHPRDIKEQKFEDVPLFELNSFVIYDVDKTGLETMMLGNSAFRYSDKYIVKNINFTDNTQEFIVNMKAKNGIYKDDTVVFNGDVVCSREDGLTFETKEATYNHKTDITEITDDFIAYMGSNTIVGSSASYDNKLNIITSKNIISNYKLRGKN